MDNNFPFSKKSKIIYSSSHKKQTGLSLSQEQISSHLKKLSIAVDPKLTNIVYDETVEIFKKQNIGGFFPKNVPNEYVKEFFKNEINTKMKTYFFNFHIVNFLIDEIMKKKIFVSNYPRIKEIFIENNNKIIYNFDASIVDPIELKEWKDFSFKTPKRKGYKNLDKQVNHFLEKEFILSKNKQRHVVENNDWVCFNASMLTQKNELISPYLTSTFWIKVKNQEILDDLKEIFLGKNLGETFTVNSLEQDEITQEPSNHQYNFLIDIKEIVKGMIPSLESFKSMFKLKNKSNIHNKLIEIFSYRNNQSQRKSVVEEIFHVLLTKHRFEIPKHLMIRRQENILTSLKDHPDYQAYRSQDNFSEYLTLLAESQLKEEIIIDQIAYSENIQVDIKDIVNYLYLFSNKQLHEFLYFKPTIEEIEYANKPINTGLLKQTIMREKMLNNIVHRLTH
jgi:FKBP-type peptidyl-prolyl cis-trans isomerase (trigger factor)